MEDIGGFLQPWAPDRDFAAEPLSPLERHLCHILGTGCLCLAVNMIAAVAVENAPYRGMALFLNTLFFAVDAFSYVIVGLDIAPPLLVIVGAGLVGLAVHSQEPGIFTKDKAEKGKSKTE